MAQASCNQPADYSFARPEENKWDAGDSFPPSDGFVGLFLWRGTKLLLSDRFGADKFVFMLPDNQHGTGCVADDVLGCAAHEDIFKTGAAVG